MTAHLFFPDFLAPKSPDPSTSSSDGATATSTSPPPSPTSSSAYACHGVDCSTCDDVERDACGETDCSKCAVDFYDDDDGRWMTTAVVESGARKGEKSKGRSREAAMVVSSDSSFVTEEVRRRMKVG